MSGCPAGARNWHISYFSMLLHSKKPVYLGFSGKQNCSDTCVPEQFFPRCQNDRTKFCIACFHGKKLPGSSPRRSFARFGTFPPRNSSQRALAGCGVFLDRGDLSACKEGSRDSGQPGAEAFSRFRRIPPRNNIGIRAARSHKERKVFTIFICARQRVTGLPPSDPQTHSRWTEQRHPAPP